MISFVFFQPYGVTQAGPYIKFTTTNTNGQIKYGSGELTNIFVPPGKDPIYHYAFCFIEIHFFDPLCCLIYSVFQSSFENNFTFALGLL